MLGDLSQVDEVILVNLEANLALLQKLGQSFLAITVEEGLGKFPQSWPEALTAVLLAIADLVVKEVLHVEHLPRWLEHLHRLV